MGCRKAISYQLFVNKICVVKIQSQTIRQAPDGTLGDRKTIGVCEEVKFNLIPPLAAVWTADAGYETTHSGLNFLWHAPQTKNDKVTITATIGTCICKAEMKVIPPDSAAWKKLVSEVTVGWGLGNAGSCMKISKLTLTPLNVSFSYLKVKECSGPPSNVAGWWDHNPPFTTNAPSPGIPAGRLWHCADIFFGNNGFDGPWVAINTDNATAASEFDTAGIFPPGYSPALIPGGFAEGSYTWVIPMKYRGELYTSAPGINFATVKQVYSMSKDGTVTVTKDDANICHVTRAPATTSP